LVHTANGDKRISEISNVALNIYNDLKQYKDSTYAYVEDIYNL